MGATLVQTASVPPTRKRRGWQGQGFTIALALCVGFGPVAQPSLGNRVLLGIVVGEHRDDAAPCQSRQRAVRQKSTRKQNFIVAVSVCLLKMAGWQINLLSSKNIA
jgi:hypothetical protein